MTKTGMRITPSRGNSLNHFTAYKVYTVISGTGEVNMSPVALKLGTMIRHSENTCNVLDDCGNIRFICMDYFREFNSEMGSLFQ